MVNLISITVLSIIESKNFKGEKMDVLPGFINDDLREEVYREQPLGFKKGDSATKLCKLIRASYGLRRASGKQNAKIDVIFVSTLHMHGNKTDEWFIFVRTVVGY